MVVVVTPTVNFTSLNVFRNSIEKINFLVFFVCNILLVWWNMYPITVLLNV